jgi:hypothetical protein
LIHGFGSSAALVLLIDFLLFYKKDWQAGVPMEPDDPDRHE